MQSIPLPKITFSKVGESREISNDGDVGDAVINLQINCIAMSLTQAKTLARAVMTSMVAAMGTTVGGTEFGSIVLEAERDIDAEIEGGVEKATQVTVQSWRIAFYDTL
jgi:hypothetical protein